MEVVEIVQVPENISMKWNRENVHMDDLIIHVKEIYRIQIATRGNVGFVDFVHLSHIQSMISNCKDRISRITTKEIFH
jgi:hypothetical protein